MATGGRPGYERVKSEAPPRRTNFWILPVAVVGSFDFTTVHYRSNVIVFAAVAGW